MRLMLLTQARKNLVANIQVVAGFSSSTDPPTDITKLINNSVLYRFRGEAKQSWTHTHIMQLASPAWITKVYIYR